MAVNSVLHGFYAIILMTNSSKNVVCFSRLLHTFDNIIEKCFFKRSLFFTATNQSPSSHIPVGLSFLFLILRAKFRNRAMLFDETRIKLFDTDIGFTRILCLTA